MILDHQIKILAKVLHWICFSNSCWSKNKNPIGLEVSLNPALFLFIVLDLWLLIASSCPKYLFNTSSTIKTFVFSIHHFINWNPSPSWNYTCNRFFINRISENVHFLHLFPFSCFLFIFLLQELEFLHILFCSFFKFWLTFCNICFCFSSSILFLIHLLH